METDPNDSSKSIRTSSNAPTVLFDVSVTLEYLLNFSDTTDTSTSTSSFGLEAGVTYAISADEDLSDNDDTGVFIGFTFSQVW